MEGNNTNQSQDNNQSQVKKASGISDIKNKYSKSKASSIWGIFAAGLVVEIILLIMGGKSGISSLSNVIIMLLFFAIVAFVFRWVYQTINTVLSISDALESVRKVIIQHALSGDKVILSKMIGADSLFGNEILDNIWSEYKQELSRVEGSRDDIKTDIEEFINLDSIDEFIKVHYMSLVPGTMTGLGILGTFVGLSIGLSSFDLSGSAEEIESKIQPLMEGIKVAFHTSICGLIYSLLFNRFYAEVNHQLEQAIEDFIIAFKKYAINDDIEGTTSIELKYQKRIESYLAEQVSAQRELNDSIIALAEEAKKNQSKELQRIVNEFVEQMNSSLGGSFKEMGEILAETSEWQKKSLEEMERTLSQIGELAIDLGKINKSIETSIEKVEGYTTTVDEAQVKLIESMDKVGHILDMNTAQVVKQEEILESIMTNSRETNESMATFVDRIGSQVEIIQNVQDQVLEKAQEEMSKFMETTASITEEVRANSQAQLEELQNSVTEYINSVTDTQQYAIDSIEKVGSKANEKLEVLTKFDADMTTGIENASDKLGKTVELLAGDMEARTKETFATFDSELAEITKHFSGTISQMDKSISKVPMVVNDVYGDLDQKLQELQIHLEEYVEYADKLHRSIEAKWKQFNSYEEE